MYILLLKDESIILQHLAAGDEAAFEKIFVHYWDNIYSTALRFIKSAELAEDITQDVFAQLWIKRETLPNIKKFDAYLFMMARNIIFNQMRRNILSGKMDDYLKLYFQEEKTVTHNTVETKELETLIRQAISTMPPKQQMAFRLSRFEGLSHEEIAQEMKISRLSVKNYIVKSLLALRQLLGEGHKELLLLLVLKIWL
jgi:RNA polymerase sigma-70 factor (family 1)